MMDRIRINGVLYEAVSMNEKWGKRTRNSEFGPRYIWFMDDKQQERGYVELIVKGKQIIIGIVERHYAIYTGDTYYEDLGIFYPYSQEGYDEALEDFEEICEYYDRKSHDLYGGMTNAIKRIRNDIKSKHSSQSGVRMGYLPSKFWNKCIPSEYLR